MFCHIFGLLFPLLSAVRCMRVCVCVVSAWRVSVCYGYGKGEAGLEGGGGICFGFYDTLPPNL